MTTNTVKFLTRHDGELSYTTNTLVKVFDPATDADKLNETVDVLASSDDWRLVTVKKYSTTDVEVPCWMDPASYPDRAIDMKYFLGAGGNEAWGREWFERLVSLDFGVRFACCQLLNTKNFRSDFRRSLRDQLVKWLNGESNYSSPFSPKQLNCLLNSYVLRDAKRAEDNLYRSGRYAA